ncbi:MAG: class I SAM-dependent methyltransferase [Acidobacteria bacterium]|nr:class I SAM-dependent methyltransferase [Acidobacteriota bacterium]
MTTTPAFERESDRIRAAYARRELTADERYSWFNAAHRLAVQERERAVLDVLQRHGVRSLSRVRVVEFGCGSGFWLREFIKWGCAPSHVTGVDLLADRIAEARRLCPSGVELICANAPDAPLVPHTYDIVLQSMLLTSVLDPALRVAVARAMQRAVAPGGLILSYDYHVNNPRNADVRALSKRDLRELFPDCRVDVRRLTLAAPLARPLAAHARPLHALCARIPWLRSHYLAAITAREADRG